MRNRHPWKTLLLILAALALLAAACGDDEAPAGAAGDEPLDPTTEDAGDDAPFPVTVDHVWGSATIEEAPERVVTLGVTDADVALALGVTPVAITGYSFLVVEDGRMVIPGKYGAYTPRDTRGQFMTQLGLELPPALAERDIGDDFYIA